MDFGVLISDEFLNSNIFSTILTGLLSLCLVCATVAIAIWQIIFQKGTHEQRLLADREDRIINIYSAFADCGREFICMYSTISFELGFRPEVSDIRKSELHLVKLSKAFDEAKLIFEDDAPILKRLNAIYEKFRDLSNLERVLLVTITKDGKTEEVMSKMDKLYDEIIGFRKNDLSDENLDNYFKPYINRISAKKRHIRILLK